jgi:glycosyltransferase involved in cell wall biosynthesis
VAKRKQRDETGTLAVILDQFPSTSETFILREMAELERRGFVLAPLALRRGEATVHAEAEALAGRTTYRARPLSGPCLWRQLVAMLRYPLGYGSGVALVARNALRSPGATRELLVALLAAGEYASALRRPQRVTHVHAQFCSMPATVGILLAEILNVTFSMSCHARDIFTRESVLVGPKLAEAEFAAVCTRHGLERLERLQRIAAGDKLHLIYHGIDPSQFVPPRLRPEGPRKVLSVGRLVEKKGYSILLQAAALARARGAEFELHLVGEGPEREDLERLASGLGLRDTAVFHGALTQEQLMPIYAGADVFALASVVTADGDRDGIPNVLIEALAMGIPTVATTTGGIPELIEDGVTGLLAQPGDAQGLSERLEQALYDQELRARLKAAGRERVLLDFDISRNTGALAALLGKYVQPREQGSHDGAGPASDGPADGPQE